MKTYSAASFTSLSADVERLFLSVENKSFFNLPKWYALVAQAGLREGARAGVSIDEGSNVGLVWCQNSGGSLRALYSCTNAYSCEYDILQHEADPKAISRFVNELARADPQRDFIQLRGLDPQSPQFAAILEGLHSAGFAAKPFFAWGTWFEQVEGVNFETYLAARPAILRNTWKRKSAIAQRTDHQDFRFCDGQSDVEWFLGAYARIHEQSWKRPEPFPEFIPRLVHMAAQYGALRFGVLTIQGVPAAAQFWLLWKGRATIFKLVHAETFSKFSPGTVLTMHMMRMVLERDCPKEIDFGRGDDTYKKMWLSSRRERWGIEAANPRTVRGLALATRITAGLARDYLKNRFGKPNLTPLAGANRSVLSLGRLEPV